MALVGPGDMNLVFGASVPTGKRTAWASLIAGLTLYHYREHASAVRVAFNHMPDPYQIIYQNRSEGTFHVTPIDPLTGLQSERHTNFVWPNIDVIRWDFIAADFALLTRTTN